MRKLLAVPRLCGGERERDHTAICGDMHDLHAALAAFLNRVHVWNGILADARLVVLRGNGHNGLLLDFKQWKLRRAQSPQFLVERQRLAVVARLAAELRAVRGSIAAGNKPAFAFRTGPRGDWALHGLGRRR